MHLFAPFNDVFLPSETVTYKTKVTDNQSITVICHFYKGDPVGMLFRADIITTLLSAHGFGQMGKHLADWEPIMGGRDGGHE